MVLSAVCAEDLAAYDDTTGHPLRLLAGILVFAPLYGGPALLIREVARRSGRGWTTMLLLAAAFGLLEAGIVDQSLFSESYRNIPSWSDGLRPTYIGPLGVSAYYAHSFVLGHVIFSFCAPIALVEAMRPKTALSPWLGPWGTAVVVLLYLAAAALVLGDHLANESSHASVSEIVATFAVAGSLAVLAFTVKPPAARCLSEPASSPRRARTVFLAGFVGVTLYGVAPQTWLGVAMAAVAVAAGVALLVRESRRPGWGVTHTAALAAGAIVSRAVLAFSYYPVIGDISAARKYVHNVAMLLVAAGISAYAIKRARGAGADDWPLSSARRA